MLVNLESFKQEEAAKEKATEELKQDQEKPSKPIQTHHAFNENEAAREENFNKQLDEIFQKNSAAQKETSPEKSEAEAGNFATSAAKKKEIQKKSTGNNSSDKTSIKKGRMRNSSISFSLRDRTAIDIPNPVYTCDVAGKVVVNITVNAEGVVLTTSINKASSNTTNECLLENAQMYASQARFSSFPGRASQIGTITYYFEP